MSEFALSREARSLAVTGALLFLAGLGQGAAIPFFANPRMALSAHLDAVQSGIAVMVAGLFWSCCTWRAATETVARWTLAAGMVGLWLGITVGAATGASRVLPIAGSGYSGSPLAEQVTGGLVLGSSAALFLGWGLFTTALIRRR